MSALSLRRILHETEQIARESKNYSDMFKLTMVGDDAYHYTIELYGPKDSLYQNNTFILELRLSQEYPRAAPRVKFVSKIEHVNVNKEGDICLDILKDKWSPALKILSIMVSVASLLSDPNPDDPFNFELAALFKRDKAAYEQYIKSFHSN